MVGCLQGKTVAGCHHKVNKSLTGWRRLSLTALVVDNLIASGPTRRAKLCKRQEKGRRKKHRNFYGGVPGSACPACAFENPAKEASRSEHPTRVIHVKELP